MLKILRRAIICCDWLPGSGYEAYSPPPPPPPPPEPAILKKTKPAAKLNAMAIPVRCDSDNAISIYLPVPSTAVSLSITRTRTRVCVRVYVCVCTCERVRARACVQKTRSLQVSICSRHCYPLCRLTGDVLTFLLNPINWRPRSKRADLQSLINVKLVNFINPVC